MHRKIFLMMAFFLAAPSFGQMVEPDKETLAADQKFLHQHQVGIDGPALLQFFRARIIPKEKQDQLKAQIEKLDSPSYKVRVQAASALVKAGNLARPLLLEAIKKGKANLELVRRAEQCLKEMEEGPEPKLVAAAARWLRQQKPAGAVEALLEYLPFATDETAIEEIQFGLNALALEKGGPAPALVPALADKKASQRGAAGEALAACDDPQTRKAVLALLKDSEPQVRFQVSKAFLLSKEKSAVPVLIDLLTQMPPDQIWEVEEVLAQVGGEKSPNIYLGSQPPAKVRDTWLAWWKKNQDTLDLAKYSAVPRLLGFTLITQMNPTNATGKVLELGPNNKINFSINNLRYPLDAQVIGRDRVLIAEYLNRRVIECDFKGQVQWEYGVDLPISCQRFPNGHTFIASRRGQLLVLDASRKEVFTHFVQNTTIAAARRLRDGTMVFVTAAGMCHWLDAKGQEWRSFRIGQVYTLGANIDPLPGGKLLVPLYRENRVVEYDAKGNVVWQSQGQIPLPTSAVRLPNGHTLVACMTQQRILELDREGKEVWQQRTEGRPWRARKR